MTLFDAHGHLQDEALFRDAAGVMARAAAAGVGRMACCGTGADDWGRVLDLAAACPRIIPMLGIHPWRVDEKWKSEFHQLERLVRAHPEAGIGETGLDFQDRFANRAEQEACFAAHLDLARELNRPVAVHCVRAWGRLSALLQAHPAPRILLHAFGGPVELIPGLIRLNGWFSFCGRVADPRAKRMRAAAAAVPDDRLLIETDCPDFPPPGCPAPNEPARLVITAHAVAEIRGVPVETIARITAANGAVFFGPAVPNQ